MTKYTFSLKNNNNTSTFFTPKTKSTDYSKILDDLILDDLIKKNPWLNTSYSSSTTEPTTIKIKFKDDNDLYSNVCKFFADKDYLKKTFIKDKIYYLTDGTPFYITDDYITIGFNTYYFYEFNTPKFFAGLSDDMKKTICTIYVDGLKITIKK